MGERLLKCGRHVRCDFPDIRTSALITDVAHLPADAARTRRLRLHQGTSLFTLPLQGSTIPTGQSCCGLIGTLQEIAEWRVG